MVHIECPECRAPVGISGLDRIVVCGHCDARSLVEGHRFIPEYFVESSVDLQTARRVLQKILRCEAVPLGMLKRSKFMVANLVYVPFNEITARRMGTMILGLGAVKSGKKEEKASVKGQDTKVIISDIDRVEAAVELKDWGLETALPEINQEDIVKRIKPLRRQEVAGKARILEPTVDPEETLNKMKSSKMAAMVQDKTEFGETRLRRIFYPVWRLRYTYQGRVYAATVDGVTGKVMGARAPENDKNRVIWLLGVGMVTTLILGKLLRGIGTFIRDPKDVVAWVTLEPSVMALLSITGFLFIAVATAVGWEQFRYPGEVVWTGEDYESVKVNRPDNNRVLTWLFTFSEYLDSFISKGRNRTG